MLVKQALSLEMRKKQPGGGRKGGRIRPAYKLEGISLYAEGERDQLSIRAE